MEQLLLYIKNLNLNWYNLGTSGAVLAIGCILTALLSRAIFGKRSLLFEAASSAVGILFIYALTAVIFSIGTQYIPYTTPLPFVSITNEEMVLTRLSDLHYTEFCGILLCMIILSFTMNITDRWLPKGTNILVWILWRCISVIATMALHLIIIGLMNKYLPQGFLAYAPVVLLCLLAIMIVTGALKIVVGVAISTINPIVAALYTFFFANIVGKQVTKAAFTTAILTGLLYLLEKLGITTVNIQAGALIAYIPYACILLLIWWSIQKLDRSK